VKYSPCWFEELLQLLLVNSKQDAGTSWPLTFKLRCSSRKGWT
jgi:hypothetical protein